MTRTASAFLTVLLTTAARATFPVGAEPPDFSCTDTYGSVFNLLEQRGKVVLVNFGATW
jgi:peroxiredoxin